MMIECPKCHFRQPKDQFCARCGVDISHFIKPEQSFWQKLLKNSGFIFFVSLIALASVLYLVLQKKKEADYNETFFGKKVFISSQFQVDNKNNEPNKEENNPAFFKASDSKTQAADNNQSSIQTNDSQNPNLKPSDNIPESKTVKTDGLPDSKSPDSGKNTTDTTKSVTAKVAKLVIYYAEVSPKGLDILSQESKSSMTNTNPEFSFGAIRNGLSKIKPLKDDINIYAVETKNLTIGKTETWFQGLKSSNQYGDIGLTNSAIINELNLEKIQGEFKISKRIKVNITDPTSQSFSSFDYIVPIDMNSDSLLMISDVLTSKPFTNNQEYLTSMTPFEILKSQNFKTGNSFSVFFLEIKE